ncbi:MAG: hypothetical protein M3N52_02240 [Actinomycetota bacterium]|nr:hypothetical protein [Actinomycetota bacterium]
MAANTSVRTKGQFVFVVVDAAHPWAADGHATTAQRNRPVLAAVALGGAGTVVLALWSREVGDLGGHQLAMTSNPTAVEVANSPFAHVLGEASGWSSTRRRAARAAHLSRIPR